MGKKHSKIINEEIKIINKENKIIEKGNKINDQEKIDFWKIVLIAKNDRTKVELLTKLSECESGYESILIEWPFLVHIVREFTDKISKKKQIIKFAIWNNGTERFVPINPIHCFNSKGFIVIYRRHDLHSILWHINNIKEFFEDIDCKVFLIGIECDSDSYQWDPAITEKAKEYCKSNNFIYLGEHNIKEPRKNFNDIIDKIVKELYEKFGDIKIIKNEYNISKPKRES